MDLFGEVIFERGACLNCGRSLPKGQEHGDCPVCTTAMTPAALPGVQTEAQAEAMQRITAVLVAQARTLVGDGVTVEAATASVLADARRCSAKRS